MHNGIIAFLNVIYMASYMYNLKDMKWVCNGINVYLMIPADIVYNNSGINDVLTLTDG